MIVSGLQLQHSDLGWHSDVHKMLKLGREFTYMYVHCSNNQMRLVVIHALGEEQVQFLIYIFFTFFLG